MEERSVTIIEILSIINSLSSDSNNLICVLFWSDIAGRTSPEFFCIADAVFMVVPPMFIAASKTVGFSRFIGAYLYVFVAVWYIVSIKWLFPAPPPPVINR